MPQTAGEIPFTMKQLCNHKHVHNHKWSALGYTSKQRIRQTKYAGLFITKCNTAVMTQYQIEINNHNNGENLTGL